MKQIAPTHRPLMRQQGLVIDELPDEVLVYDLERHKAHCLNQTAGLVWKHCDGQTAPPEIARRLEKELQAPCPEEIVWLALRQLKSLHLLEEPITEPPRLVGLSRSELVHLSRRQMVRTLGLAAIVAVPLVTSIVSPTPAHANSPCSSNGTPCMAPTDCCSGVCSTTCQG
jgi:hypothetical protein